MHDILLHSEINGMKAILKLIQVYLVTLESDFLLWLRFNPWSGDFFFRKHEYAFEFGY